MSSSRRSDPAHLLHTARGLFLRYGFRRTSMEDVARAAGVAKGTVYLAFASKEALFRGVCAQLCDELLGAAEAGALDHDRPLERARARLEAKYLRLHEWVNASPHAAELLASSDALAAAELRAMDGAFRRALAAELRAADRRGDIDLRRSGMGAREVASLLMRAARSCSLSEEGGPVPALPVVRRRLDQVTGLILQALTPADRNDRMSTLGHSGRSVERKLRPPSRTPRRSRPG